MPDLYPETVYQPNYSARVLFAPECKWRLVEEFGMESFKELPDGKLLFAFDFTDMAQLYRWLPDLWGIRQNFWSRRSFGKNSEDWVRSFRGNTGIKKHVIG